MGWLSGSAARKRDVTTPAENDRRSTLGGFDRDAADARIYGFRQMFNMPDGSIFSAMVNPPRCIAEWHTNGEWLWGLVDSGADYMHLVRDDAKRMGFNLWSLRYDQPVSTGGGVVNKAVVTIPEMRIGRLVVRDVKATVGAKDYHPENLIGKSFLLRIPGGFRLIEEGVLFYP